MHSLKCRLIARAGVCLLNLFPKLRFDHSWGWGFYVLSWRWICMVLRSQTVSFNFLQQTPTQVIRFWWGDSKLSCSYISYSLSPKEARIVGKKTRDAFHPSHLRMWGWRHHEADPRREDSPGGRPSSASPRELPQDSRASGVTKPKGRCAWPT